MFMIGILLPSSTMAKQKILIMITSPDPDDAISSGTRYEYTFPNKKEERNNAPFDMEELEQSCAIELQSNGNLVVEAYHPIYETWDLAWESESGEKMKEDSKESYYLHLQLSGGNLVIYQGTETQPIGRGIWSSRTADEGVDKLYMYNDCTLSLEGEKNSVLWRSTKQTLSPTSNPSLTPSFEPSLIPTSIPSIVASQGPTILSSSVPSSPPSISLSNAPSLFFSNVPSLLPTSSSLPTMNVSLTSSPTFFPTFKNSSSSSFKALTQDMKATGTVEEVSTPTFSPSNNMLNASEFTESVNAENSTFEPTIFPSSISTRSNTFSFMENITDDENVIINSVVFDASNSTSFEDLGDENEDTFFNTDLLGIENVEKDTISMNTIEEKVNDESLKDSTEEIQFTFQRTKQRDVDIEFNFANDDSLSEDVDFFFNEKVDHSTDVTLISMIELSDPNTKEGIIMFMKEEEDEDEEAQADVTEKNDGNAFDTEEASDSEMLHFDWKETQLLQPAHNAEEEHLAISLSQIQTKGKSNDVAGSDMG